MSDQIKLRILSKAHKAFLDFGYSELSMIKLAELCGLTRRGLYYHFSSKEEVFRASLRVLNAEALASGDQASDEALAAGGRAVDVIAAWLDARFGTTRRKIGNSPHGRELNDMAFRLATDVMIEVSYESNRKLVDLVAELCRREQLRLRDGLSAEQVGGLIGDGARGVNQARPPIPNDQIAQRYVDIVEAILFGCALMRDDGRGDR